MIRLAREQPAVAVENALRVAGRAVAQRFAPVGEALDGEQAPGDPGGEERVVERVGVREQRPALARGVERAVRQRMRALKRDHDASAGDGRGERWVVADRRDGTRPLDRRARRRAALPMPPVRSTRRRDRRAARRPSRRAAGDEPRRSGRGTDRGRARRRRRARPRRTASTPSRCAPRSVVSNRVDTRRAAAKRRARTPARPLPSIRCVTSS